MQTLAAFRALWQGLRDPRMVPTVTASTAVAIFAAAVLLMTLADTTAVYVEGGTPSLAQESAALSGRLQSTAAPATTVKGVPQREFTAALGGALMISTVSIAALAGMLWMFMRFLTNERVAYWEALGGVSATAGIDVLQTLVITPLHVLTGTIRYGFHAGVVVDPTTHPHLFLWLQRLDLFSVWHYLAAGMVVATWRSLHYRYGLVIGAVVFVVVQAAMGLLSLVSWLLPAMVSGGAEIVR